MTAPRFEDTKWHPRRPPHRRGWLAVLLIVGVFLFGGTLVSWYVDSLWFGSLGYGGVFWTTLRIEGATAGIVGALTFAVLYGSFLALKPRRFGDLGSGGIVVVNGQPIQLPVEPVLRLAALILSAAVALVSAASLTANWPAVALWWYGSSAALPDAAAWAHAGDPIFGRPITFYLFTLPVWQLAAGWLLTLAVVVCVGALFFFIVAHGGWAPSTGRLRRAGEGRGLAIAWACVLALVAVRVYLGRFGRLFEDHGIFSGVTYTDAHVLLTGALVVCAALLAGAAVALWEAYAGARIGRLLLAAAPAAVCYIVVGAIGSYVSSFVVRPNQLVREQPYLSHNIELTRRAFGLGDVSRQPFPADSGVAAIDAPNNQATLQNVRLWDWRALQDTLRQIQEIRTYYDFPDIDIDRYRLDGTVRQVMLAARELNVGRLPVSSRTWVNQKLIYTHGYGVTMNPVNGFTPEGLPQLVLKNMPVESASPDIRITRPEIYFGEMTTTDVYVKTRQREFNYPQGQTNELTSYEGTGGIPLGGFFRRLLLAIDRGDLAKLPFSDDVTADSRLLMRRDIRSRVAALAPFLAFDEDPYIVVRENGRLSWMLDGFTTSNRFPYSRAYRFDRQPINYLRNSVKAVIDAYDGTTTFYVFDPSDPIIHAYSRVFPELFKPGSEMPADLQAHVRYPELLLSVQAEVFALYHMTDPAVFYNREDLWAVATQVSAEEQRGETAAPVEPSFVLMSLPGEERAEFVEILPFTPANRNNLIGWIAGRSDEPHYGEVVVYEFPKTRLIDGPLQIEARIDQDPELSSQLSLWNRQGSRVRRGTLLVLPVGKGLLYAEPIFLQAQHSPMPELRLVILALQDRLVHAPTFEDALAQLFGERPAPAESAAPSTVTPPAAPDDLNALIAQAAQQMADYQRLTAEGKLGEAGRKLEELKRTLDELQRRRR
ncbi:MAG TPA: UPF0182 family protein [Vicinamibacterales bacterium]|nr:UPF0182 family protein [Vicinamibacterales bacterium]